jgi:hypothetical protein
MLETRVSERRAFDVWNEVPLVPQLTGMSCWAAAAAMIIGWRDVLVVNPEEVAQGAGRWAEYREGLHPLQLEEFARAWGLRVEPSRDWTVRGLQSVLERNGPVWLGEASPGLHSIVVTGMYGDGTPEGTHVRVNDPWPVDRGERYTLTWSQLMKNFQAAADLAGVHAQVLHAGGRRGGPSGRSRFAERRVVRTTVPGSPASEGSTMHTISERRHHESYESGGSLIGNAYGGVPAGSAYVSTSTSAPDPLAGHGGSGENLYLAWNALGDTPSSIDVVVHLHGYSPRAADSALLRGKVEAAGVDLARRTRPTLCIVPRGRKITAEERRADPEANPERYTFPALTADRGAGLERLIAFSLARLMERLPGASAPVVDRLILTAHSGGGAPLNTLLAAHAARAVCNPHEVHVFDALYGSVDGILSWVAARIAADRALPASELPTRGGALRILHGAGTAAGSKRVAGALPGRGDALAAAYRVQRTTEPHGRVAQTYGPALLADARAEVGAVAVGQEYALSESGYGAPIGLMEHYRDNPPDPFDPADPPSEETPRQEESGQAAASYGAPVGLMEHYRGRPPDPADEPGEIRFEEVPEGSSDEYRPLTEAAAVTGDPGARPGAVRARILWPALGFPAVIAPRTTGSSDPLEGNASSTICVLLLSNKRHLSKEEAAAHLRIVRWGERGRRRIESGQPGSFAVADLQVRNDDSGRLLAWPKSDRLADAVVFGGSRSLTPGADPEESSVVVSLARYVREFYRRQGLEHLHEIRISEAASARLGTGQYHLFWNDDADDRSASSGEMQLLIEQFAKPRRRALGASWQRHFDFFVDEYRYDFGALHAPYQRTDPQRRLTEVLHPVFIRPRGGALRIGHITDTHVDVRPDVYQENLRRAGKLGTVAFNNYNEDFVRIYREVREATQATDGADVLLLTGDLIDYGRGHVGLSHDPDFFRSKLGEDGYYHTDRNWFLFYYLLASGGRYTHPVYTCLGNHDWRLSPYPPFAPGAPDPESLMHNAEALTRQRVPLKPLIESAHGPGHRKAYTYSSDAESALGLVGDMGLEAVWAKLACSFDRDKSPLQTTVESVAWYLMLINPFLDYSVKLPGGQQLLMLDWGEDEELCNRDAPRHERGFGERAGNSLTQLQKWHVDEFVSLPGSAKIIGTHAPPIGPSSDWSDAELEAGIKKYPSGKYLPARTEFGKHIRLHEHPLFAVRPRGKPFGMAADYGSFVRERDWFIERVGDPRRGVRLVLSGHIHRAGLLVVRTPASDRSLRLIRGVRHAAVRGARAPAAASADGKTYLGPLYVNTTSAGPRGHVYQNGHRYVAPGYALITLASNGTIENVSPRQLTPPRTAQQPPARPTRPVAPQPVATR